MVEESEALLLAGITVSVTISNKISLEANALVLPEVYRRTRGGGVGGVGGERL